jgi:tetratricopeptide (TPR) repeat protein
VPALLLCTAFLSTFIVERKAQAIIPPAQFQQQAPGTTGGSNEQGTTTLEAGNFIERELAGGQKHIYEITLAAGQCAGVIIEQRGIDVLARLLRPDGKLMAEFDDELRSQGRETPELVAEERISYRLEVEAKRLNAPVGNYSIRFEELRAATDKDRTLQEARGLLAESARLWRAGKYDAALVPGAGALEARERVLGPEHPSVAAALNNLAIVYYSKEELDKAESLYQRTLKIREKALGPDHPGVSELLTNMAALYAARSDSEQAIKTQSRASMIIEHNVALNLATGSERQKLAYLTKLSEITDQTVSLHTRTTPDNPEARGLAVTTILQRKGRVQDAMADSLTMLRQRFNPLDQKLLDELNYTTAQLGRLVLNGPQRMGVYGLRRAFVLAGTETLVMSLWPVSDYATSEIMAAYYKGLKQGLGRGEALRQVQLGMLKRRGREHPFYWAEFHPIGRVGQPRRQTLKDFQMRIALFSS